MQDKTSKEVKVRKGKTKEQIKEDGERMRKMLYGSDRQ